MDGGNITIMAQRTYLIFRDIEGKLDTRRVECTNAPAKGAAIAAGRVICEMYY
jgi:hypothetical protein